MNKRVTLIIVSVLVLILIVLAVLIGVKSCGKNGEADELNINSDEKGVTVDLETGSIIEDSEDDEKDDEKAPNIFEPGSSKNQESSSTVDSSNSDTSTTSSSYSDMSAMDNMTPWY